MQKGRKLVPLPSEAMPLQILFCFDSLPLRRWQGFFLMFFLKNILQIQKKYVSLHHQNKQNKGGQNEGKREKQEIIF